MVQVQVMESGEKLPLCPMEFLLKPGGFVIQLKSFFMRIPGIPKPNSIEVITDWNTSCDRTAISVLVLFNHGMVILPMFFGQMDMLPKNKQAELQKVPIDNIHSEMVLPLPVKQVLKKTIFTSINKQFPELNLRWSVHSGSADSYAMAA